MSSLIESEPGFVLHARQYKEHSLLIEAFSLNYGRISLTARSAKKQSSRLKALLQPFTPLTLSVLKGRSELWMLQDCSQSGASIQLEVPELFCGTYVNELLYHLLKHFDPAPELFGLYLNVLHSLEKHSDVELQLRLFELSLLKHLGLELDFHLSSGSSFNENDLYGFDINTGFFRSSGAEQFSFKGRELNALAQERFDEEKSLLTLKTLTRQCLSALLGPKKLLSRELYRNYIKTTH